MVRKDVSENTDMHNHWWIIFISGPTASGKSTVAEFLGLELNAHFIEGDEFHSKANIEKMHRGEPLSDADRQGWLDTISDQASTYARDNARKPQLVVTCSALKRHYRQVLREGCKRAGFSIVHFIHLDAPESELRHRAEARLNHFAKPDLVHSQFQVLERPGIDESDATIISVVPTPSEVCAAVLNAVTKILRNKCN